MSKKTVKYEKIKKLSKLGIFSKGKGISKAETSSHGMKAIRYAEIYTNYDVKAADVSTFIPEETSAKATEIEKGDIVFATSGETLEDIGKSVVYLDDDRCFVGGDTIILRPKGVDPLYLAYVLNNSATRKQLWRLGQGQSVVHIYKRDLKNISIDLPHLPEQRRIVEVLETINQNINSLTERIVIAERTFTLLLDRLLDSDAPSKTRKKARLGDLGSTYPGLTGKSKEDFGSGEPYISYMNIYTNLETRVPSQDESVVIEEDSKQNSIRYGDIFFTTSSETPHEVGMSSVQLVKPVQKTYLNSFCFGYRMNDLETLTPELSKFLFRSKSFRKKVSRIAQGASRYNLSKKYFLELEIDFPADKAEQSYIVQILSSTEQLIDKLKYKRKLLENQRKYLINNLTTGKLRFPEFTDNNNG